MLKTHFSKVLRLCSLSGYNSRLSGNENICNKFDKLSNGLLVNQKRLTSTKDKRDHNNCKLIAKPIIDPAKSCLKENAEKVPATDIKKENYTIVAGSEINTSLKKDQSSNLHNKSEEDSHAKKDTQSIVEEDSHAKKDTQSIVAGTGFSTITAKNNTEHLEQRVENIEETPLVEAARPNLEGRGSSNTLRDKVDLPSEINILDEVAKRCLGAPENKIDDTLLKELKQFGKSSLPQETNFQEVLLQMERDDLTKTANGELNTEKEDKTNATSSNIKDNEFLLGDASKNKDPNQSTNSVFTTYHSIKHEKPGKSRGRYIVKPTKKRSQHARDINLDDEDIKLVKQERIPYHHLVDLNLTNAVPPEHQSEPQTEPDSIKQEILPVHILHQNICTDYEPTTEQLCTGVRYYPPEDPPKPTPGTTVGTAATKFLAQDQVIIDPYDKKTLTYENKDNVNEASDQKPIQRLNYQQADEFTPVTADVNAINVQPVFAVETSRLDKLSTVAINNPENDSKMEVAIKNPENDFKKENATENVINPDTIVCPFVDKTTMDRCITDLKVDDLVTPPEIPSEGFGKSITLSELLKRVRERNHLEAYTELLKLTKVKPVVGTCNKPIAPCPPSAPMCPPPKTPPPKPCARPKPAAKPKCPDPCAKPKNPCAKIVGHNPSLKNMFCLLMPLPEIGAASKYVMPVVPCNLESKKSDCYSSRKLITEEIVWKLYIMGLKLRSPPFKSSSTKELETKKSGVCFIHCEHYYGKDYKPWVPIPSWPTPAKDEKKKLVCPKEGCKPPRIPCPNQKPCLGFPKRV